VVTHRNRAVSVAIGLAIAGCIGAASIPVADAYNKAHRPATCAERATTTDPCTVTQTGSVRNPEEP